MSFSATEATRRIVWNALHEIEDDTVRAAALDAYQAVVSRLAYLEKEHERETWPKTVTVGSVRFEASPPLENMRVSVPDEISFCDGAGHSVKVST